MGKNNLIKFWILFVVSLPVITSGCDSGDIYPKDKTSGGTDVDVSVSFQFTHIDAFPESYKIVFGSFNDDLAYPISSKVISKPSDNGVVTVSLANIPENTTYLALYLVQEHSNYKIYPFYTYPIVSMPKEDFEIPLQNIDLAMFGRVQKQVFSQCLQCHGGSGFAAAGLHLTEGKSHEDLVGITALHNTDKKRISPGNIQNSYLMDILKGEALPNQHSSLSSLKDDDIVLVEQWIKGGAKSE